jgi:CRISPR/Cas system-associated exonuclease Cas4 (RecB family)
VERSLFTYLKKEGKARFYWDFDRFYMKEHEAGHFMRQNLADFPNELDMEDADIYDCFKKEKHITFVSAPTENVQARYVSQWLRNGAGNDGVRTAVVLCDEQLLPMVVHCLPAEVGKANITTGYPLIQSPVASLITQLFNLKTQGYQPSRDRYRLRHVNAMLRHPYIGGLSPEIPRLQEELNTQKVYYPTRQQLTVDEATTLLFGIYEVKGDEDNRSANSGTPLSAILQWMCDVLQLVARSMAHEPQPSVFEQESLFHGYTLLNRLLGLVNDGDLLVDIITLQRLVGQLIQTSSIPFHGEPAEGVQVMGVLETRNLDFDHVLLLSCNEGNMPRGVNDTSFIPYSIRKTYGLTTIDHKVAIFSYYFHRLLQRAGDVTILYNNATTDGHTGEMSRFMLQLMVEDPHHQIAFKTLRAGQAFTPFRPQAVEKTEEVMQRLLQRFVLTDDRSEKLPLITPTAINRYMRCPLLFYYTYAYNLREPDINDDDTIDNRIFGNIFHEAARLIYTRLMEKSHQILATDIEWLLRTKVDIERAVDEAIRAELFSMRGAKDNGAATDNHGQGRMHVELNGLQLINRAVIIHYLRQLLDIDRRLAPFTIIGLETDVVASMTLNINSSQPTKLSSLTPLTTSIGGRIDRLDRIVKDGQECVRVIDYKTGSHQPRPLSGVEAIFRQESLDNHSDYYLQTLLYSSLVSEQQQRLLHTNHPQPVAPALLFIQHAGGDDYDPILKFGKEPISDIAPYKKEFGVLLRQTLDEMFNPALPFVPTADKSRCTNCPYKLLCT